MRTRRAANRHVSGPFVPRRQLIFRHFSPMSAVSAETGDISGIWCFRAYVEQVLLPVLRPGDIVILDNLGSHRSKAVRQLIRSVGAKLFFLPKYSPDLNPIEQVFAKLKHLIRKAAARTVDAVCAAIGHALNAFTSEECANYLKNTGYRT